MIADAFALHPYILWALSELLFPFLALFYLDDMFDSQYRLAVSINLDVMHILVNVLSPYPMPYPMPDVRLRNALGSSMNFRHKIPVNQ